VGNCIEVSGIISRGKYWLDTKINTENEGKKDFYRFKIIGHFNPGNGSEKDRISPIL
jgi:hypothetical protein